MQVRLVVGLRAGERARRSAAPSPRVTRRCRQRSAPRRPRLVPAARPHARTRLSAGMTHGIHMADTDECGGGTAVVELFPATHAEKGIRNMVVGVGRRYFSWTNGDPSRESEGKGTTVDVAAVVSVLTDAASFVLSGRAC